MEFVKKNTIVIFSVLIFISAFLIRGYYASQKIALFSDETATYTISTFNNYGWKKYYDARFYSGKELRNVTFEKINTYSQAFDNIKKLYVDNNGDNSHTNLYYSIFNLWMVDKGSYFEFKELVNRALSLNFVFFCLSFFFMFKLLNLMFEDKKYVPLGLGAAFLNTASISNTLFIRPYQMQETIFIFLTLVFAIIYKKIQNDENVLTPFYFILFSAACALTLLTGYFAPIYIIFLLFFLVVLCEKKKSFKNLSLIFTAPIAGLLTAMILYKGYLLGYQSDRASDALVLLNIHTLMKNLVFLIYKYILIIFKYLFSIPIFLFGLFLLNKKDEKGNSLTNSILISAFLWSLASLFLAPYKIIRYVMPIFPVLALSIPYLVSLLKDNYKKIAYTVFFALYFFGAIFASTNDEPKVYLKDLKLIPNVENTNQDWNAYFEITKDESVPVVLYDSICWYEFFLAGIGRDNQDYLFLNMLENLPEGVEHYYVMCNKKDFNEVLKKFENDFDIKDEAHFDSFSVYEIKKRR